MSPTVRRLLKKSRQEVMVTWTSGIEVEMLGSGQILPPSLLPTSYLDHCKKMSPVCLTVTQTSSF